MYNACHLSLFPISYGIETLFNLVTLISFSDKLRNIFISYLIIQRTGLLNSICFYPD